jgi:hypothetical protein
MGCITCMPNGWRTSPHRIYRLDSEVFSSVNSQHATKYKQQLLCTYDRELSRTFCHLIVAQMTRFGGGCWYKLAFSGVIINNRFSTWISWWGLYFSLTFFWRRYYIFSLIFECIMKCQVNAQRRLTGHDICRKVINCDQVTDAGRATETHADATNGVFF